MSVLLRDPHDLIHTIMNQSVLTFKNKIRSLHVSELNEVADQYNNRLLHLAVKKSSHELVQILLDKNVLSEVYNKFDETPWMLAVISRNNSIIEKFVNHKIDAMKSRLEELESELSSNKGLSSSLYEEIDKLKLEIREKNSELLELRRETKRLRSDKDELTESNKKLRLSVQTLMEASRK